MGGAPLSISDGTNTFINPNTESSSPGGLSMGAWYAPDIVGVSGPITIVFPVSAANCWVYVLEYSGLSPGSGFDNGGSIFDLGGSTDVATGEQVSTSVAKFVLITAAAHVSDFVTYEAGPTFTLIDGAINDGVNLGGIQERLGQTQLGSFNAQMTASASADEYMVTWISFGIPAVSSPSKSRSPSASFSPSASASDTWIGKPMYYWNGSAWIEVDIYG